MFLVLQIINLIYLKNKIYYQNNKNNKIKMRKEITTKIKNEKELQIMRDLAKVHKEVFDAIKETTKV